MSLVYILFEGGTGSNVYPLPVNDGGQVRRGGGKEGAMDCTVKRKDSERFKCMLVERKCRKITV